MCRIVAVSVCVPLTAVVLLEEKTQGDDTNITFWMGVLLIISPLVSVVASDPVILGYLFVLSAIFYCLVGVWVKFALVYLKFPNTVITLTYWFIVGDNRKHRRLQGKRSDMWSFIYHVAQDRAECIHLLPWTQVKLPDLEVQKVQKNTIMK